MSRSKTAISLCCLSLGLGLATGCSPDNSVSDIQQSPAATNADEAGRKAVLDSMKSKTAGPKSSSKDASAKTKSPEAPK